MLDLLKVLLVLSLIHPMVTLIDYQSTNNTVLEVTNLTINVPLISIVLPAKYLIVFMFPSGSDLSFCEVSCTGIPSTNIS